MTMTSAASQLSDAEKLARMEQAVADVNRRVQSAPISDIELPALIPSQFSTYYSQFGHRFVRYLHYAVHKGRLDAATTETARTLKARGEIQSVVAAQNMAQALYGFGDCGPKSYLLWASIPGSCCITTSSNPVNDSLVSTVNFKTHAFVVDGLSRADTRQLAPLSRDLLSCGKGVIGDPLLGISCLTPDVATIGKELPQLLHILGCKHMEMRRNPEEKPIGDLLRQDGEKILAAARPKMNSESLMVDQQTQATLAGFKQLVKDHISPSTKAALSSWTGREWKVTFNPFWGDYELTASGEHLTALAKQIIPTGLPFQTKRGPENEILSISIKNPDPCALRLIEALAPQWGLKTASLCNLIALYAEGQ
jgi:hypothetical protein